MKKNESFLVESHLEEADVLKSSPAQSWIKQLSIYQGYRKTLQTESGLLLCIKK